MKIKIWDQSLVSDFHLLFPLQVMVGMRKTFLTFTYIVVSVLCVLGFFWFFFLVIALFSQIFSFFFFQNPIKKIPDSHEITLQHGTKTVSDNKCSIVFVFLELTQSMK